MHCAGATKVHDGVLFLKAAVHELKADASEGKLCYWGGDAFRRFGLWMTHAFGSLRLASSCFFGFALRLILAPGLGGTLWILGSMGRRPPNRRLGVPLFVVVGLGVCFTSATGSLVLRGRELSTSATSSMSGLIISDPARCPIVKWARQPILTSSAMLDYWAPDEMLDLVDAGAKALPDEEEALLSFGGVLMVEAAARSDAPQAGSPPPSEGVPFAPSVACPPQWLPMLLAMYSYYYESPAPPPLPPPLLPSPPHKLPPLPPLLPQRFPDLDDFDDTLRGPADDRGRFRLRLHEPPLLPPFLHSSHTRRRALLPAPRYVNDSSQLTTALDDSTVDRIVLRAGTYELTSDYSQSGCSDSALCINRAVTIEAEMPGSVVLDAKKGRRVFYIQPGGAAELIGLNITGGKSDSVTCPRFEPSLTFPPAPP